MTGIKYCGLSLYFFGLCYNSSVIISHPPRNERIIMLNFWLLKQKIAALLLSLIAGFLLTGAVEAAPVRQTTSNSASLQDLLYNISSDGALNQMKAISSFSRCLYDPGHAQAGDYIAGELRKLGYEPIFQDFPTQYRGATGRNIIVRKPGTNPQATHLLVGHWDASPTTQWPPTCNSLGWGANDNASGSAALLEIARVLSAESVKFQDDIQLVWFDAEEFGFLGSYHYVGKWKDDRTINPNNQPLGAVINLDMISYTKGKPKGELWAVSQGAASYELTKEGAELVKNYVPGLDYKLYTIGDLYPASRDPNRQSDQKPFWEAGLGATIFLIESVADVDPRWHTPRDTVYEPDGTLRINPVFMADAARTALAIVGNRAKLQPVRLFPNLDGAFERNWSKADRPVRLASAGGTATGRGWLWGPQPVKAGREPYADSPGGTRAVVYFDKARMELGADGTTVTNGLLVTEMTSGRVQLGDNKFEDTKPSEVPVAGDDNLKGQNPAAPTYASFTNLPKRASDMTGRGVADLLLKNGATGFSTTLGNFARYKYYEPQMGHNIPDVFMDWFAGNGRIYDPTTDSYTSGNVFDWVSTVGLPISEAYWVKTLVGAVERDVLVQLFERRVLTYTPTNSPEWRVEMGNVGLHYINWR
jgi:hypothetical protein